MENEDNFGAGVFEGSKSEEKPTQVPPTPLTNQPSPSPTEKPAESPVELGAEEEAGDEGSSTFFAQQERDREKAMLLRRSREDTRDTRETRDVRPEPFQKSSPPRWNQGSQGGGGRRQGGRDNRDNRGGGGGRFERDRNRPEQPERTQRPVTEEPNFNREPSPAAGAQIPAETAAEIQERRGGGERRTQPPTGVSYGPVLMYQRVAVFVDVQNMYHSARKLHGRNLSYSKLLQNTVRGRQLIRAIAYLLDREGVDQGAFLDHLSNCGFEIRRKELIERADGSRKGDWDLGIASDVLAISEKVDVIILVSGDGDFISLTQMLKHRGVKVEIASFRDSTSESLVQAADGFHSLGRDSLY